MADGGEGNKEGDGLDMRGLEGNWEGARPLEGNGPKKDTASQANAGQAIS
jgi:hypothetical protein